MGTQNPVLRTRAESVESYHIERACHASILHRHVQVLQVTPSHGQDPSAGARRTTSMYCVEQHLGRFLRPKAVTRHVAAVRKYLPVPVLRALR